MSYHYVRAVVWECDSCGYQEWGYEHAMPDLWTRRAGIIVNDEQVRPTRHFCPGCPPPEKPAA